VSVNHTIIEAKKSETGNGTRFSFKKYVKDEDIRSVGVSAETIGMLAQHVSDRGLAEEDLLFSMPVIRVLPSGKRETLDIVDRRNEAWPCGLPVSRSYFRGEWIAAVAEAGIPYRRRHDLRASFISWLLDDPNMSPQHVMDIVGHGRWETTKRYKKSLDRHQELGVAAIENVRKRYRAT
jgi:integrase